MVNLELKRHKEDYEVNLFYSKNSKSHYHNIIDKDYNRLSQILMDLYLEGFPVEEAFKIFFAKVNKKDWLGLE